MKKYIDLSGERFGRLVVDKPIKNPNDARPCFLCCCDCGHKTIVRGAHLRSGDTQSCGCLQKERVSKARTIHAMTNHPMYHVWDGMMQRCGNPKHTSYINYGGRGIKVCSRWQNVRLFILDMGNRPSSRHTLERIDNNGNYEPGNCRWATRKEQGNNKRTNRIIAFNGQQKTLTEWSEQIGISDSALQKRLKNWPLERALRQESPGFSRGEVQQALV